MSVSHQNTPLSGNFWAAATCVLGLFPIVYCARISFDMAVSGHTGPAIAIGAVTVVAGAGVATLANMVREP